MNGIFFAFVVVSFFFAAIQQLHWTPIVGEKSPIELLGQSMIGSATDSVTLAISLIGVMALFLGLMKVAEKGGLLVIIAKVVKPLMIRLFPDVPATHPAMGAMIMNISANSLGLGNAATPFGIKAMQELDKLNTHKGVANNAMVLFLAINTSSVTLLPSGVIALRAAADSMDPAGILPTTLFATICSTITAIVVAKLLQNFWSSDKGTFSFQAHVRAQKRKENKADKGDYPLWVSYLALLSLVSLVPLTVLYGRGIAPWIIPLLMILLLGFGFFRGVRIYEAFVEGAQEGFKVAVKIIPYLVAILVAVGMFRASGAMEFLIGPIGSVTGSFGLPTDAIPMAILRPLSGSGAYGVLASIIQDPNIGPDSYVGYLVSTLQGSTETTFYVLAVYFGAIQIKKIRHALFAALSADIMGIAASVFICSYLFLN